MWNLKTHKWVRLSTPLTSIPYELRSIGKLNTSLTPKAPLIVFIVTFFFSWVAKIRLVVKNTNDLNTQTVSQFYNYFIIISTALIFPVDFKLSNEIY